MTPSPPVFILSHFFTSAFVNDFGIDVLWWLHHCLEGLSSNVPSFSATYFGETFLQNYICLDFPSFSVNPRRHKFYWGIHMILVHATFSKISISMRSNSENYRHAGLFSYHFVFDVHELSASFSVSILSCIVDGRIVQKWSQNCSGDRYFSRPSRA